MNIAPPSVLEPALEAVGPPVFNFIFGVPQLGVGLGDGQPGVHMPTEWPYDHPLILGAMMFFSGLTVVLMTLLTILNVIRMQLPGGTSEFQAGRLLMRSFGATLFVMLFYLPVVALGHAFGQAAVMGFAPTIEQVTSSWGSLFQFSVSVAFVAGAFIELGWEFTKWMGFIHALSWLFLILMPVVGQPFVAIRIYRPKGRIGAMAESFLVIWPALIVAKIFSALLINIGLSIDWGANLPGVVAAFVSLGVVFLATIMPVLLVLIALLSRSRILRSSVTLGAGAMAGSTLARGARWGKEKAPNLGVKEKAGHGAKKAAAKTQSTYWDAKSRAKAGVVAAGGNWKGAAGERLKYKFSSDGSGGSTDTDGQADSASVSSSSAERIRQLEESSSQSKSSSGEAGERHEYYWMKQRKKQSQSGD